MCLLHHITSTEITNNGLTHISVGLQEPLETVREKKKKGIKPDTAVPILNKVLVLKF